MKRVNDLLLLCLVAFLSACTNRADDSSGFVQLIEEKSNPKINELFSFVEEQYGGKIRAYKRLEGDGRRVYFSKSAWVAKYSRGSKEVAKIFDLICEKTIRVFDELALTNKEVSRYENHTADTDTIKYAINLTDIDGSACMDGDDHVLYHYLKGAGKKVVEAYLEYLCTLAVNNDYDAEGERAFRYEDYEKMVMALLDGMDINRAAFSWKQKEEPISDAQMNEKFMAREYTCSDTKDGYTTASEGSGYKYFFPLKDGKLANEALNKLSEVTLKFLEEDPFHSYTFSFDRNFEDFDFVYWCLDVLDVGYSDGGGYKVSICKDDKGYYILLLSYVGDLWLPRDILN